MKIEPLTLNQANALISQLHRHHKPVVGHRFSIGLRDGDRIVGAVVVGRPVARHHDDQFTAEVTRLVTDGTPNACSMLYAAAWRAWRSMGGESLGTYILDSEPGTSLRAAGWKHLYDTPPRHKGWDTPTRPRDDTPQPGRQFWEIRNCID